MCGYHTEENKVSVKLSAGLISEACTCVLSAAGTLGKPLMNPRGEPDLNCIQRQPSQHSCRDIPERGKRLFLVGKVDGIHERTAVHADAVVDADLGRDGSIEVHSERGRACRAGDGVEIGTRVDGHRLCGTVVDGDGRLAGLRPFRDPDVERQGLRCAQDIAKSVLERIVRGGRH
jgi:hypothetical protein